MGLLGIILISAGIVFFILFEKKRRDRKKDIYECNICNDRDCHCEKKNKDD